MSQWTEDYVARLFGLEGALREALDVARDIADEYNPEAQYVSGDMHESLTRLKFLFEQLDRQPTQPRDKPNLVDPGPRRKWHSGIRE